MNILMIKEKERYFVKAVSKGAKREYTDNEFLLRSNDILRGASIPEQKTGMEHMDMQIVNAIMQKFIAKNLGVEMEETFPHSFFDNYSITYERNGFFRVCFRYQGVLKKAYQFSVLFEKNGIVSDFYQEGATLAAIIGEEKELQKPDNTVLFALTATENGLINKIMLKSSWNCVIMTANFTSAKIEFYQITQGQMKRIAEIEEQKFPTSFFIDKEKGAVYPFERRVVKKVFPIIEMQNLTQVNTEIPHIQGMIARQKVWIFFI